MWSTHSRRIDPISRSTKPFCQGEAGAFGLSRMPMARSRRVTTHRKCSPDLGSKPIVGTTNKSSAAMSGAWLCHKVPGWAALAL
jgi:hypothetical protein